MTDKTSKNSPLDEDEKLKIEALEIAGNQHDDEEVENEESESTVDRTDYSNFTKNDFVVKARELIFHTNINEAHGAFKKMRVLFDDIVKKERESLLQVFVAEGNEPKDFRVPVDEVKIEFYALYTKLLERRTEEKKRAEEEKVKNLKLKKEILEKIRILTESEESENSLDELKKLQQEWKQIRTIPKEQMEELWDSYRFLLDKFYDNLSIFNELKDLDRQKNLEAKIELTKKMGELLEEKSIKHNHIILNKLHDEFKNIGPVPKEYSEEVWQRFKAASDKVIEKNKALVEDIKEKRKVNLELKTVICEKVEQIAELNYKTPKDWNQKSSEIESLFEEWKTIGPVPEYISDQIWKRFREAQNVFYKNRKEFYASLNSDKEKNYTLKLQICEKAEKLSSSSDFERTAIELMQLQEKWKTIGPVSEKQSAEIWTRFRAACDAFFKRREINRSAAKEEEQANLAIKEGILEKLQTLHDNDEQTKENVFEQLRILQKEWSKVGFVPKTKFHTINTKYEKLSDAILKKHKLSTDEFKQGRLKEHLEMLAQQPNGKIALKSEERKITDRIRTLSSEIQTFENNIGFFANSKGADALKKQFEDKINSTQAQIKKLEGELKMLRTIMR